MSLNCGYNVSTMYLKTESQSIPKKRHNVSQSCWIHLIPNSCTSNHFAVSVVQDCCVYDPPAIPSLSLLEKFQRIARLFVLCVKPSVSFAAKSSVGIQRCLSQSFLSNFAHPQTPPFRPIHSLSAACRWDLVGCLKTPFTSNDMLCKHRRRQPSKHPREESLLLVPCATRPAPSPFSAPPECKQGSRGSQLHPLHIWTSALPPALSCTFCATADPLSWSHTVNTPEHTALAPPSSSAYCLHSPVHYFSSRPLPFI